MAARTNRQATVALALQTSGYSECGVVLDATVAAAICRDADRALSDVGRANRPVPFASPVAEYRSASAMHLWSDETFALLSHEAIVGAASELLTKPRLNDATVFEALRSDKGTPATTSWHRDCPVAQSPGYLWFWWYLDAFTPQNGAPWVVPGSHRDSKTELGSAWAPLSEDQFPDARQLTGPPGSLVVVDARTLHSSGSNYDGNRRRLLVIGLVDDSSVERVATDHWSLLDSDRRTASDGWLQQLFGADLERSTRMLPVLPADYRPATSG